MIEQPTPEELAKWESYGPEEIEKRKRHQNLVIQEIISTEQTYVEQLQTLIEVFLIPLRTGNYGLNARDIRVIFSNVEILFQFNTMLLEQLQAAVAQGGLMICKVFLKIANYLKTYTPYVSNLKNSQALVQKLLKTSKKFAQLENEARNNPRCKRYHLATFLVLPVQRIPRYELLLRELIKNTPPTNPESLDLRKAYHKMTEISASVDEAKKHVDQSQRLIQIKETLTDAEETQQIIISNRRCLFEAPAIHIQTSEYKLPIDGLNEQSIQEQIPLPAQSPGANFEENDEAKYMYQPTQINLTGIRPTQQQNYPEKTPRTIQVFIFNDSIFMALEDRSKGKRHFGELYPLHFLNEVHVENEEESGSQGSSTPTGQQNKMSLLNLSLRIPVKFDPIHPSCTKLLDEFKYVSQLEEVAIVQTLQLVRVTREEAEGDLFRIIQLRIRFDDQSGAMDAVRSIEEASEGLIQLRRNQQDLLMKNEIRQQQITHTEQREKEREGILDDKRDLDDEDQSPDLQKKEYKRSGDNEDQSDDEGKKEINQDKGDTIRRNQKAKQKILEQEMSKLKLNIAAAEKETQVVKLTDEEKMQLYRLRHNHLQRFLLEEKKYYQKLKEIIENYLDPLKKAVEKNPPPPDTGDKQLQYKFLRMDDIKLIFGPIDVICRTTEQLLKDLGALDTQSAQQSGKGGLKIMGFFSKQPKQDTSSLSNSLNAPPTNIQEAVIRGEEIGKTFRQVASFMKVYSLYVASREEAQQRINSLVNNGCTTFSSVIQKGFQNACNNGTGCTMEDLLSEPLDHLTLYSTIISSLIDSTPFMDSARNYLQEAESRMQAVEVQIETLSKLHERRNAVVNIANLIQQYIELKGKEYKVDEDDDEFDKADKRISGMGALKENYPDCVFSEQLYSDILINHILITPSRLHISEYPVRDIAVLISPLNRGEDELLLAEAQQRWMVKIMQKTAQQKEKTQAIVLLQHAPHEQSEIELLKKALVIQTSIPCYFFSSAAEYERTRLVERQQLNQPPEITSGVFAKEQPSLLSSINSIQKSFITGSTSEGQNRLHEIGVLEAQAQPRSSLRQFNSDHFSIDFPMSPSYKERFKVLRSISAGESTLDENYHKISFQASTDLQLQAKEHADSVTKIIPQIISQRLKNLREAEKDVASKIYSINKNYLIHQQKSSIGKSTEQVYGKFHDKPVIDKIGKSQQYKSPPEKTTQKAIKIITDKLLHFFVTGAGSEARINLFNDAILITHRENVIKSQDQTKGFSMNSDIGVIPGELTDECISYQRLIPLESLEAVCVDSVTPFASKTDSKKSKSRKTDIERSLEQEMQNIEVPLLRLFAVERRDWHIINRIASATNIEEAQQGEQQILNEEKSFIMIRKEQKIKEEKSLKKSKSKEQESIYEKEQMEDKDQKSLPRHLKGASVSKSKDAPNSKQILSPFGTALPPTDDPTSPISSPFAQILALTANTTQPSAPSPSNSRMIAISLLFESNQKLYEFYEELLSAIVELRGKQRQRDELGQLG